MTQPTTRTTFKDYCKRKLGWPVVELNIDDDQVEDCIDDSLQFFQEYHFDATENTFLKHQISGSTLKLAGAPTGTFSNGEIITGGTSGVQATVHAYHSANTTLRYKDPEVKSGGDGNTFYANTTTTFSTGETITGNTSSATATTHASTATAIGDFDNKYISIAEAIIGSNVTISMAATATTSVPAGNYVYDIEYTQSDTTTVERVAEGMITISAEATK